MIRFRHYDAYLQQPVFLAIRRALMRLSGGVCEICHQRPATEPHHIHYPKPWGTFDTVTNMKAVCHECHTNEHNQH